MGMRIFPQITLIAKKASTKSDQHHIPVQRSRTISSLSVIILLHLKTSDEFFWSVFSRILKYGPEKLQIWALFMQCFCW